MVQMFESITYLNDSSSSVIGLSERVDPPSTHQTSPHCLYSNSSSPQLYTTMPVGHVIMYIVSCDHVTYVGEEGALLSIRSVSCSLR